MSAVYADWQTFLLCGAVAVPLLVALLFALPDMALRMRALDLAAWSALPACLSAMLLPDGYVELHWLMLGSRFGLDETGRVFVAFTAFLWLVGGVYARGYLRHDPRAPRFFAFFLLSMAGNLGLVLAQDALGFFVFFTLMSFAAYGLVVHESTPENLRAGRIYMVLAIVGEVLLFGGLVLLGSAADTLRFPLAANPAALEPLVIVLLATGFGIKAGALPLHVWLPLAHPAAPTPASAVLSGAMIKAGLLGWLRFLPLGEAALPEFGAAFVVAGLLAAFYGVALGVVQSNPKTVLAYSSISQMGFMTVAVGLGLAVPQAWPALLLAILVYAVHHGLAKGALFLGVGAAMQGARKALALGGMAFAALALAGAPLTSGAVAKSMLKGALPAAQAHPWLAPLLGVAAIGTTVLMARLLFRVAVATGHAGAKPAVWLWFAWTVSLAAVAVGALLVPHAAPPAFDAAGLWAAVWPVAAGVAFAFGAGRAIRDASRLPRWLRPPAGDIVVPVETLLGRVLTLLGRAVPARDPVAGVRAATAAFPARARASLQRAEERLADWASVGLGLLGLIVVLFALLAYGGQFI